MAYTLNENLRRWAEQYENEEFIKSDPVQIPHRYDSRVNIEISAFVTAWIAWGSREQIIKKADFIDREIFKGEPYHYILGTDTQGTNQGWRQYNCSRENLYRTFTYGDFYNICFALYEIYKNWDDMEEALQTQPGVSPLKQLLFLFEHIKGVPSLDSKSGCKRLCLFLRWMCRHNSPVDFGLWTICEPRNLIIPLDTHVHSEALRLGLTSRRTVDLQCAIEITDRFIEIFPNDPTKGDFALFGYGINRVCADGVNEIAEATKDLEKANEKIVDVVVSPDDLSISDVLKMPLFFENVKAQLVSLWSDRENARKKAAKNNQKLRAHVIDRMHNTGEWEPGKFIVVFGTILDKVAVGYSANDREFIRTVGMIAFNITMQKLIDDEKKRNHSDGDNK